MSINEIGESSRPLHVFDLNTAIPSIFRKYDEVEEDYQNLYMALGVEEQRFLQNPRCHIAEIDVSSYSQATVEKVLEEVRSLPNIYFTFDRYHRRLVVEFSR